VEVLRSTEKGCNYCTTKDGRWPRPGHEFITNLKGFRRVHQ